MEQLWLHELALPFRCVSKNKEFNKEDFKEAINTARFFLDKIEELNHINGFNYKGAIHIGEEIPTESKNV